MSARITSPPTKKDGDRGRKTDTENARIAAGEERHAV
jgi:hypothetical protein